MLLIVAMKIFSYKLFWRIKNRRVRASNWSLKSNWVSSLMRSAQYQRSKGVKFGGIFIPGKNDLYYQKMNNKDMLLPVQVGRTVARVFVALSKSPSRVQPLGTTSIWQIGPDLSYLAWSLMMKERLRWVRLPSVQRGRQPNPRQTDLSSLVKRSNFFRGPDSLV